MHPFIAVLSVAMVLAFVRMMVFLVMRVGMFVVMGMLMFRNATLLVVLMASLFSRFSRPMAIERRMLGHRMVSPKTWSGGSRAQMFVRSMDGGGCRAGCQDGDENSSVLHGSGR